MKRYLFALLLTVILLPVSTVAQTYNQIDEMGNITQYDELGYGNCNPHNNDTTKNNK
jgi:hypothetical protein